MKSAFELAMERLEQSSGPGKRLSDTQKAQIAEIDALYDARIAETKLTFEPRIATAGFDERAAIQEELSAKLRELEGKRTDEKEAVWQSAE